MLEHIGYDWRRSNSMTLPASFTVLKKGSCSNSRLATAVNSAVIDFARHRVSIMSVRKLRFLRGPETTSWDLY